MYLLLINLALVFRIESQLYNLIEIPERRISPNTIEGMQRTIKSGFPYAEGNDWTAVLVIKLHRDKLYKIEQQGVQNIHVHDPVRFG